MYVRDIKSIVTMPSTGYIVLYLLSTSAKYTFQTTNDLTLL